VSPLGKGEMNILAAKPLTGAVAHSGPKRTSADCWLFIGGHAIVQVTHVDNTFWSYVQNPFPLLKMPSVRDPKMERSGAGRRFPTFFYFP